MILLLFSQEYIIEGITIKGDINKYFSYEYIDSTMLNYFSETNELFLSLTELNLFSYGSPLLLNQLSIKSNSSKNLIFNLNGIPVNDIKTGIFDISLIPIETIYNVEIFKSSFSISEGSMDGVINLNKKIKNNISLTVGNHNDLRLIFSKEIKGKGLSIYFRDFGGYRKNSDGRIFNISYIDRNIFLDWTYKKTGLPGPKPFSFIPEFGDSDVYSLYDNEKDYLFLLSYDLKRDNINILPYISYSKMIPYSRYRDYFTGNIVDETDDYRVYTAGLKFSFDKFFNFSVRFDSIYMKGLDTLWGKDNFSILLSQRFQNNIKNFIINMGASINYDKITGFNHNEFIGLSLIKPINLYILLTKDYRKPSYNELFWPNYSNPELKSEKSNEIIIGLKFKEYIDLSFFKKWIRNKISLNENWIPDNIDSVFTEGLNLSLSFNLEFLKFNTIIKYTDGKEFHNTNQFFLQHIPKNSFKLNLFIFKEPEIFIGFVYNGNVKKINFDDIPSYYIINTGIIKNVRDIKINFSVNNLLNKKYYTNFGYSNGEYYPGEPFGLKVSVSKKI